MSAMFPPVATLAIIIHSMLVFERDGNRRRRVDAVDAQGREISVRVAADELTEQRDIARIQGDVCGPE